MKLFYSILALLVVLGCGEPKESGELTEMTKEAVEETKTAPLENSPEYEDDGSGTRQYDYQEFKNCYRDFFVTIMDDNESKFNSFINSEYGLYIIDAPGATPKITKVYDISNYQKANGKSILSVGEGNVGYELIEEDLPKVDCDEPSGYAVSGCYTANTNRLITTEIWKHADLRKEQQSDFVSLAETIAKTVVNTANYTYYFSFVDGSWYLTFIDVRKPCVA